MLLIQYELNDLNLMYQCSKKTHTPCFRTTVKIKNPTKPWRGTVLRKRPLILHFRRTAEQVSDDPIIQVEGKKEPHPLFHLTKRSKLSSLQSWRKQRLIKLCSQQKNGRKNKSSTQTKCQHPSFSVVKANESSLNTSPTNYIDTFSELVESLNFRA
ncbi:unnamed protein product [Cuscuta epithymum]|uniref:Uncharacterized protein n=1 Tax=Cuscuta epithymum TaxID=186058 RepID=A0AAV0CFL4_9ASTE|nr:unnamed protein product [Cuscuta epithymum]